MAGHEDTGSESKSEPGSDATPPFGRSSALHREKPVIEGQAVHVPESSVPDPGIPHPGLETTGETSALSAHDTEAVPEQAESEEKLAEKIEAKDAAANTAHDTAETPPPIAHPPVTTERHRGFSFGGVLAAALIGAATGFACAYVARVLLDDSQKTFTALDERLSGISTKLAADEKKIDAAGAASQAALSALDRRLSAAEKSTSDALGAAKSAQQAAAQAHVSSSLDSSGSAPAAAVDLTPLQSKIDDLEQRLAQLETAFNTPKTAERAPQEREAKPDPQEANAPAIAIVAENLVQKIASGAPFATELAALDKLGADKTKLAALQPLASKGVASAKALSDQLGALTPSLLATEKPAADPQENVFARILNHARQLVRVRRVDDLSGDDLSARIARVQDALVHDDIDRALQEWSAFPAAAKSASTQWAEAAKARAATIAAAKAIDAEAMANLAKIKS